MSNLTNNTTELQSILEAANNLPDVVTTLSASAITAGTFAGEVAAGSGYQTPGASLLRNSKLVSSETNPTVNGEINWTYE